MTWLRTMLARAECLLYGHGPFVDELRGGQRGRVCAFCGKWGPR